MSILMPISLIGELAGEESFIIVCVFTQVRKQEYDSPD
jgi:hypothetical protein